MKTGVYCFLFTPLRLRAPKTGTVICSREMVDETIGINN